MITFSYKNTAPQIKVLPLFLPESVCHNKDLEKSSNRTSSAGAFPANVACINMANM